MTLADCCSPVHDLCSTAPADLMYALYKISRICQNRHLAQTTRVAASVIVKVALKPGFDR